MEQDYDEYDEYDYYDDYDDHHPTEPNQFYSFGCASSMDPAPQGAPPQELTTRQWMEREERLWLQQQRQQDKEGEFALHHAEESEGEEVIEEIQQQRQ